MAGRTKEHHSGSLIGKEMQIDGSVVCQADLLVEGSLEGQLQAQRVLVRRSGRISGEMVVSELECSGTASGTIRARHIRLTKNARVEADLSAAALDMEAGAGLGGRLQISSDQPPEPTPPPREQDELPEPGQDGTVAAGMAAALKGGSRLILVVADEMGWFSRLSGDLTEQLGAGWQVVPIGDSSGSFREILLRIAALMSVDPRDYSDQEVILQDLAAAFGEQTVLLLDRVGGMYPATLEQLVRHLAGPESGGGGPAQLVLFGGGDLKIMLERTASELIGREPDCVFEL